MDEIKQIIGTAFLDTYGDFCLEAINAGYSLDYLYDASNNWGDFSKVFIIVAVARGATSYEDYLKFFEEIKPEDHQPASKQLFVRVTGISTAVSPQNQAVYNKTYRHKKRAELQQARELIALKWIDENTEQAQEYIDKITSVK